MNYQQLLEQVEEYVRHYFQVNDAENLIYHNKKHTQEVAAHATEIANHYQLNDRDFFVVVAAAWFHDLGYFVDLKDHEEQSATLAQRFLNQLKADAEDIKLIQNCIRATKIPQSPITLAEKIVCDADLYHLGTNDFLEKDKLMRKEYNLLHGTDLSKLEWHRKTLKFLEAQHYNTDYCRLLLEDKKQKNLEEIESKITEKEQELASAAAAPVQQEKKPADVKPVQAEDKPKKAKTDRPEKGIETMFRISSGNHQRLSDMADNKAHIMITVNSIILSAIISLLLRKLSDDEYLIIPTIIILTVSLLAMTFAILSTRPALPPGTFTREDVDNKNVNLLFFGNFYKMSIEDYKYGMAKMMEDREFLYGSLTRDVYSQGIVLGKKYRLLRISYNIFMFGLILSVLVFVIAAAFFGHK